jgi:hypothetical protein
MNQSSNLVNDRNYLIKIAVILSPASRPTIRTA